MNEADAIDLIRDAVWTAFLVTSPMLVVGMLVGIVIALLQALTQVQEMTLTFVPKIGAILAVGVISAPFIYQGLSRFAFDLFERVATGF
ncbi:flagellar biosynthesis protein FliQ [Tepidicaulis marinus]|jgi:flagellar biosynthetic protein FliQ|uniref:Flagellar biosynthetic protein FliQ n=1 Tax=Tepidicaulis marinus TaxID=1333998 RepID=A0A081BB48_9HYPH|nr:flagellar biosynthesis protein FliQ [Tepidicaulis marinus]GAK45266.1 flagellar biosynthesis protein FliQ [Tepidicaulis marinus]